MFFRRRCCALLSLVAALLPAGCSWTSKSRIDAAQSQNRILAEQNKTQLAEIQNLKIHSRSVEDELIQAEKQLARLDDEHGRDRRKLSNYQNERERLQQAAGLGSGPIIPAALSGRLAELANRYPSLQYDAKTGISKFDTDILFDSGEVQLKPAAKRMLGEFAEIFQAPEAANLKIMVVGHTDAKGIKGRQVREHYPSNWHLSTARALAVAEKLRQAGIPEERMGVAGFGEHQPISPNDTASARQKNRRVEIFVVGPETPVVGWTETTQGVYR